MLVTDRRRLAPGALPDRARQAAAAGVDWIQLREKDLGDRELLALARAVLVALEGTPGRLLVNGRPDVATLAGAHGVQLPEQGLPAAEVRRAFPDLVVGVSCHSPEAALRAESAGAHFVVLGPLFATPGKDRPLGPARFAEAARGLGVPAFAIGGIDLETAPSALAAGASGLAAIRLFLDPPEPLPGLVRRLKEHA